MEVCKYGCFVMDVVADVMKEKKQEEIFVSVQKRRGWGGNVVVTLTVVKPISNDIQTMFSPHGIEMLHGRTMAHGESDATLLVSM